MTHPYPARTGLDALLTPSKCCLLLIDHQPFQFSALQSHDPGLVLNNVIGLAKQKPVDRTTINTWEDPRVVDAVATEKRKKLVIAALWTEVCLAMPVLGAAKIVIVQRAHRVKTMSCCFTRA